MSIENFVPTIWAGNLLEILRKSQVYGSVCNRDYEGEIKGYGDTVKINQLGAVTVSSYTPNSTTLSYQSLQDADVNLLIDQSNYFAFKVDDVDKAQARGDVLGVGISDAAYQVKDTMDAYIAGLYGDAGITGGSGTAALGTSASELTITTDGGSSTTKASIWLGTVARRMDDANVPTEGRWLIVPPFAVMKMVQEKLIGMYGLSSDQEFSNGKISRVFGIDIYVSNNVSTDDTEYRCMGGYRGSITLAEQIVSTEALRLENSFHDAVRGLHVYGAKVVRPDATVLSVIKEGSS